MLHASKFTCKFVQGPHTLSQPQSHHGTKPLRQLLSFLKYLQWCNEKATRKTHKEYLYYEL